MPVPALRDRALAVETRAEWNRLLGERARRRATVAAIVAWLGLVVGWCAWVFARTTPAYPDGLPLVNEVIAIGMVAVASLFFVYPLLHLAAQSIVRPISMGRDRRVLDEIAWRPRLGMSHPAGRSDTDDRYVLDVVPDEASLTVTVRLVRWRYEEEAWGRATLEERRFDAGDDRLDEYERGLREQAVELADEAVEERIDRERRRALLPRASSETVG